MFSARTQRRISIFLVVIVTLGIIALALGQTPPPIPPGPTGALTLLFA